MGEARVAEGGMVPGVRAPHPRFFSWASLLLITPLCVLGSVVGMQVLVRLGVTTNTALIGALAAMGLGRVPLGFLRRYRDIHVQNLAQSAISAATFGAANSLLLPIGIPFLLGRPDLVPAMLAGAVAAGALWNALTAPPRRSKPRAPKPRDARSSRQAPKRAAAAKLQKKDE